MSATTWIRMSVWEKFKYPRTQVSQRIASVFVYTNLIPILYQTIYTVIFLLHPPSTAYFLACRSCSPAQNSDLPVFVFPCRPRNRLAFHTNRNSHFYLGSWRLAIITCVAGQATCTWNNSALLMGFRLGWNCTIRIGSHSLLDSPIPFFFSTCARV